MTRHSKRGAPAALAPLLSTARTALPSGPPLFLEQPGNAAAALSPFLLPERLARMQSVLAKRTRHVVAYLEEPHDPHNVSACMRSADAFGFQDVYVAPEHPETFKISREVSQGTQRWLTMHRFDRGEDAVRAIKRAGYLIAATDLGGDSPPIPLADVPLDAPICLAFGNEHRGITPSLRAAADLRVHIPMAGFVESLNISVACAVALSLTRQRLDARDAASWQLPEAERCDLLDAWVIADVPRARAVLGELGRRALKGNAESG